MNWGGDAGTQVGRQPWFGRPMQTCFDRFGLAEVRWEADERALARHTRGILADDARLRSSDTLGPTSGLRVAVLSFRRWHRGHALTRAPTGLGRTVPIPVWPALPSVFIDLNGDLSVQSSGNRHLSKGRSASASDIASASPPTSPSQFLLHPPNCINPTFCITLCPIHQEVLDGIPP